MRHAGGCGWRNKATGGFGTGHGNWLALGLAFGNELLQLLQLRVIEAAQARFLAADLSEDARFFGKSKGLGDGAESDGIERTEALFRMLELLLSGGGEQVGFDGDHAAQSPTGLMQCVDEGGFGFGLRLMAGDQAFALGEEAIGILIGKDEQFGIGAVLEGVKADALLAVVRAGAGGVLGVFAIDGVAVVGNVLERSGWMGRPW